jgi:hypothetical protein
MLYIYALLIGLLSGILGLGPGGMFVAVAIVVIGRKLREWAAYADQQMAYRSVHERWVDAAFERLRDDAELEEQRERRAHRVRLANSVDVPFRVIK